MAALATSTVVATPVVDPSTDLPLRDPAFTVDVRRDGVSLGSVLAENAGGNDWRVTLTSTHTGVLGELVTVWPDGVRAVEVVGSLPVTRAQLRSSGAQASDTLTDPSKTASWRIDRAIAVAVDECAEIIGVSPVVRRVRERHVIGAEQPRLYWCRWRNTVQQLVAVTVDGVALSAGDVAALKVDGVGRVLSHWPPGTIVTCTYDHGDPSILTAELLGALQKRCRHLVQRDVSAIPDRAERSFTDGNGRTVWLAAPGMRRTGLDDVDAVYARHSERHGLS